jgi:hypothetical protein
VLRDHDAVGALKRRGAGEHLVGHDAERVQVAPAVDLLARRLLGAHVRGRATATPARCWCSPSAIARAIPEVGEHGPSGRGVEQNVLRLDVPVDHARPSRGVERRGQVGHDMRHGGRIEPPVADETLAQAFPLDLVHDVVEKAVGVPRGVDGDDVGVPEAGDGARLRQEAAPDRLVGGELRVHRLDGDAAVERGVGGEEDDAHAAPPQLAFEPVLPSQHGLQRVEEIEGRSRHGPTGSGERNRKYSPARPPLDASPRERVARRAYWGCFGLNPC